MGLRGPAPKPTAIRVLEGNPSHRPLNKREPQPPGGPPRCPAWLDKTGRTEWRRVVKILGPLRLATEADRISLALYCDAYSQYLATRRTLKAEGMSYRLESGYVQQRPEVSIYHKLQAILRNWCHEFGMTPSARGRMAAPAETFEDELDALLG